MRTITVFSCLILSVVVTFSQPSGNLKKNIDQLELYYSAFSKEKVIIQTDKDYYQPAEKVWFSAWVWSSNSNLASTNHSEVMVKLLDADGKILQTDKYLLNAGTFSGDLLLPNDLEAGSYFLCALLPNQEDAEDVYFRKIIVRPVYPNSMLISLSMENEILKKGINNEINIQIEKLNGSPAKNQKLEYSITSAKQTIVEGKLKADENGKASIQFKIPEDSNGSPFILSVFDNKKATIETVRLLSESDQITIDFYPEGGTLIPDIPFKVGFYVTDKLGNPVNIEGEIKDEQNNSIIKIKTFSKGYGFCPFHPSKNKRYTLHITNGIGKGQKFSLPAVNSKGSALTIDRNSDGFLWINSIFADQQSHKIAIIVSQKANVYWGAEAEINGQGILKIPINELPQGIVLVSSFSVEGFLLNQRLVNINKNEELKIELATEAETIKKGKEIALDISFFDKAGNPLSGAFLITASDVTCIETQRPILPVEWNYNTILKNKISTNENLYQEGFDQLNYFDYFLIANELKDHDWTIISEYNPNKQKIIMVDPDNTFALPNGFEQKLKEKAINLNQADLISDQMKIKADYYVINSGIINPKSKRKVNDPPANSSYKKFLETSSSLIEVLKIIRPFSLEGNKIIFPGGQNSINAQGGALIVIDGQQMGEDASVLNGISTHDVEDINISTSPVDIQRYTGLNSVGVVEITTKRGKVPTLETNDNLEAVMYDGEYRVPKYFEMLKDGKLTTTAYWNGQININELGKTSLKIPGPNVVSNYLIIVEGIGANARFGHAGKIIEVTE